MHYFWTMNRLSLCDWTDGPPVATVLGQRTKLFMKNLPGCCIFGFFLQVMLIYSSRIVLCGTRLRSRTDAPPPTPLCYRTWPESQIVYEEST